MIASLVSGSSSEISDEVSKNSGFADLQAGHPESNKMF